MGWTNPKSWAGSEVLTSGDMNTYVGSNIDYLYDNFLLSNQWKGGTVNVTQNNQRVETGTCEASCTTTNYGSVAVTFNTAFGSIPRVFATCSGSATEIQYYVATGVAVGTAGFKAFWFRATAGTETTTHPIHWMAIGA